MLLDTYFYHLPRAIPAHECEDIIAYGKSLNPKEGITAASKTMLSDEEKREHSKKIRSSKTVFIGDTWLKKDLQSFVEYANSHKWYYKFLKDQTFYLHHTRHMPYLQQLVLLFCNHIFLIFLNYL